VDVMSIDASEREELTRELARVALHRAAPDELAIFDDLVVEYFADPQAALHPVDRDETLGFGLDLTLLTPYVLAAAAYVLPLLNEMMTEVAKEQGSALVGSWVSRLIHREARPGSVQLTVEQARKVQAVAFEQARRAGLDDNRARLVADSIAGAVTVG
jgi:hypothetical protein